MVLEAQIRALIEYMENHKDLALGHINRSTEGRSLAKQRWEEIALILNGISPDCPNKLASEWRSFFNEYKSKLLKKIKDMRREMVSTGGSHRKKYILTPLQKRLHDVLRSPCQFPPTQLSFENYIDQKMPVMPVVANIGEDVCMDQEAAPPGSSPDYITNSGKRRRRKSMRCSVDERDYATLEAAQERLERMEAKKAEAAFEQARATNRLAAAIEKIGEIITLAVASSSTSPTRKKQRRRINRSSGSESD